MEKTTDREGLGTGNEHQEISFVQVKTEMVRMRIIVMVATTVLMLP
jgi:hypothetical protein